MNLLRFWTRVLRFITAQQLLPAAPARRQLAISQRPTWEIPAYLRKMRSGDSARMRY